MERSSSKADSNSDCQSYDGLEVCDFDEQKTKTNKFEAKTVKTSSSRQNERTPSRTSSTQGGNRHATIAMSPGLNKKMATIGYSFDSRTAARSGQSSHRKREQEYLN